MDGSKILITGANGQLGKALAAIYPSATKTNASALDITDAEALKQFDWSHIEAIINTAAYTDVDGAQTAQGRITAAAVNDRAIGNLAELATNKGMILVHISTDYVFDGTMGPHKEDEPFSPLGVYGKTKAAGDENAAKTARHYIVRTSWVIGEGKNFVRTMFELGQKGVSPTVVSDQIGRPTFTTELAKAIKFLLDNQADYGTYNITNEGEPVSWADFTRAIFKEAGFNLAVTNTTTEEYYNNKPESAPRPLNSLLDLTKIESIGYKPRDWHDDLKDYVKKEISK